MVRMSTGRDSMGNGTVFPVSGVSQRNGSRASVLSASIVLASLFSDQTAEGGSISIFA